MALPKSRYRGTDQPTFSYWDDLLVTCPRCAHSAVVRRRSPSLARVTCSTCSYTAETPPYDRDQRKPIAAIVRGQCPTCGEITEVKRRLLQSQVKRRLSIPCADCDAVIPKARVFWRPKPVQPATDPYFHLPLYLQAATCGHRLWALNAAHLVLIRNYVAADLRERVPFINRSTVSRLPSWMKHATNRPKVLRSIATLEARLLGRPSKPMRRSAV